MPDVFVLESLAWKDVGDGIKIQQHQSPDNFYVIRCWDHSALDRATNIPLVPGTILVFEATRSIEYVDRTSARKVWKGNKYGNRRWGQQILQWNGESLGWERPSSVSGRASHRKWDVVNDHTAAEVVDFIKSGRTSKPQRGSGDRRSGKASVDQLQRTIHQLRAVVATKDAEIAEVNRQLAEVVAENNALRSCQFISAIPHPPSPSSLVPTVRCPFYLPVISLNASLIV